MSNLLRLTLRYSLRQRRLCSFKNSHNCLIRQSPICFKHPLSFRNEFHTSTCNWSLPLEKHLNKLDYGARKKGYVSVKDVEDTLEEMKATPTTSSTEALMLIRCCGDLLGEESFERRTQLVQEIWNSFEQLGIPLDLSHYNALLRVYLENNHPFDANEVLADMELRGLEPNRITFQRLITRYCQEGDIKGALKILEHMREKGMVINKQVFNALVLGYSLAGDMASAEGILDVMMQAEVPPTASTYTNLITGYIKQGNIEKISEIVNIPPIDVDFVDEHYLEMAYNFAIHGYNIDDILWRIRRGPVYNKTVMVYIYKLVAAGKVDAAYQLLCTMVVSLRRDGSRIPIGKLFIDHLVRCNVPLEEIVKFCNILVKEKMHPCALNVAMETSLRCEYTDIALKLFQVAKKQGLPVREHYFWPILVTQGKGNNVKGLLKTLSIMTKEYGLKIGSGTIRDYVAPYLLKDKPNVPLLLLDLKSCGVPVASSVSAFVICYLLRFEFTAAAEIASSYRAYYPIYFIRRILAQNYAKNKDMDSFTTILKEVIIGLRWRKCTIEGGEKNHEDEGATDDDESYLPESRESIGNILLDVIVQLKREANASASVERMLKGVLDKGIGIGPRTAIALRKLTHNLYNPNISPLLDKLESIEMESETVTQGRFIVLDASEETVERLRDHMEETGQVTNALKKQLFMAYGKNYNLEKLLKLKKELDQEDFFYSNGMYAMLIDAYVNGGKVAEALETYKSACAEKSDFGLSEGKLLRFAVALVENNQDVEAIDLLNKAKAEIDATQAEENTLFSNNHLCWKLLNVLAERGDAEKINTFFDMLVKNELCEINNVLLGPLIKVHVKRNDLTTALKVFEKCCEEYRTTPWKNELTRLLIEKEDDDNLRKIVDLSTKIHGEINSLGDLMQSYLETGRLRQARQILETQGLLLKHGRLRRIAETYHNEGAINHLENLISVTKDLSVLDKDDMYYNLLLSYDKTDQPNKAVAIWTQLQELDFPISEPFLVLLASIMKRHGMKVPFTVPDRKFAVHNVPVANEHEIRLNRISREFRELLKTDLDKAMSIKNSATCKKLNNVDLSFLLERLLQKERYEDAKNVYDEFMLRDALPLTRVLKYYTLRFKAYGDHNEVARVEQKFNSVRLKVFTSNNNKKCIAYLKAGNIEEYLNELEELLEVVENEGQVDEFVRTFPKEALFKVLSECPKHLAQVQRIAHQCYQKCSGYCGPLNIVWMHLLVTKNYDAADEIWAKYLRNCEGDVKFAPVLIEAKKLPDSEIAFKLRDALESKPKVLPAVLGVVYGYLAEILVKENKVREAVKVIEQALTKLELQHIKVDSLHTLKTACLAQGVPFKFDIKKKIRSMEEDNSDDESD